MTIAIAKEGIIFMFRVAYFGVGEKTAAKKKKNWNRCVLLDVSFCADGAKLEVYSDRSDKGLYP